MATKGEVLGMVPIAVRQGKNEILVRVLSVSTDPTGEADRDLIQEATGGWVEPVASLPLCDDGGNTHSISDWSSSGWKPSGGWGKDPEMKSLLAKKTRSRAA